MLGKEIFFICVFPSFISASFISCPSFSLISLLFFFRTFFLTFCLALLLCSFIHTNGGNIPFYFLKFLNERKFETTWNPIKYYKPIGLINSSYFIRSVIECCINEQSLKHSLLYAQAILLYSYSNRKFYPLFPCNCCINRNTYSLKYWG